MEDLVGLFFVVIAGLVSMIAKGTATKKTAKRRPVAERAYARPLDAPPPIPVGAASAAPKPAVPQVPIALQPTVLERPVLQPASMEGTGRPLTASGEGMDPCHEEMLSQAGEASEESPVFSPKEERAGLTLDWTGDAMVKAFVMQEVLKRPAERRQARVG